MSNDLNNTHWNDPEGMQGTTRDVSIFLKNLIILDRDAQKKVIEDLFSNILDQGTLHETTIFFIPFLIESLESDLIQCRGTILFYLAELALFCSFNTQKNTKDNRDKKLWLVDDEDPWLLDNNNYQKHVPQQNILRHHIYDTISQGGESYLKLFASNDPEIRSTVLFLFDALGNYADEVIPIIQLRLLEEMDPCVKASMLIYLGFQTVSLSKYETLLRRFVNAEREHPLVKIAASLSHIKCMREKTPQETIRILLEALPPSQEVEEMYALLPWTSKLKYPLTSAICVSLLSLSLDSAELLISKLLAVITDLDRQSQLRKSVYNLAVIHVVHALLHFAFYGKGIRINEIPFLLTNTQRNVLTIILTSPLVTYWNSDIAELMDFLGFPYPWKLRLLLCINS